MRDIINNFDPLGLMGFSVPIDEYDSLVWILLNHLYKQIEADLLRSLIREAITRYSSEFECKEEKEIEEVTEEIINLYNRMNFA